MMEDKRQEISVEYSALELNYLIPQRVQDMIKKQGSVENAIAYCEIELKWCLDNWNLYSYDCVGHAITCNSLLIPRLKAEYNTQNSNNGRHE